MKHVVFNQSVRIDTGRDCVVAVCKDVAYALTDYHIHELNFAPVFRSCTDFLYRRYEGQPLGSGSLLVLWLAGLGDTLCAVPALIRAQECNSDSTLDIASVPMLFEVFQSAGFRGRLIPYPTPVKIIEEYDYFLPSERWADHPERNQLDSIDFFARWLHQTDVSVPVKFHIDESVRTEMQLPKSDRPRIGVQVRGLSPVRSYPSDQLAEVLKRLVHDGFEVHLLGGEKDCDVPSAPPRLHNDCGRTRTFAQTAALVQQMDVMVCPDSYLMHLAGMLSIPTVAIFTTIPARLRTRHYPTVHALEPRLDCAPCLAIHDHACPNGHPECLAFRTPSHSPDVILDMVRQIARNK